MPCERVFSHLGDILIIRINTILLQQDKNSSRDFINHDFLEKQPVTPFNHSADSYVTYDPIKNLSTLFHISTLFTVTLNSSLQTFIITLLSISLQMNLKTTAHLLIQLTPPFRPLREFYFPLITHQYQPPQPLILPINHMMTYLGRKKMINISLLSLDCFKLDGLNYSNFILIDPQMN